MSKIKGKIIVNDHKPLYKNHKKTGAKPQFFMFVIHIQPHIAFVGCSL